MTSSACFICGSQDLRPDVRTSRLEVSRCRRCGHRTAFHRSSAPPARDYHEQYEQGDFLSALERTRHRQARMIVALIRSRIPDADALLDFGAGRGWFLEECRTAGLGRLAGVDSSPMSVRLLREKGFVASDTAQGPFDFSPRILSVLDVLEHIPPDQAAPLLRGLVEDLGERLELVVVKVPVSSGALYRAASFLARRGIKGPLERLYQVGTFPPHFHYFSDDSLRRFFTLGGLRIVRNIGDPDFEPDSLIDRVTSLRGAARIAGRLISAGIHLGIRATGLYDSRIVFARPSRKGTSPSDWEIEEEGSRHL